MEEQFDMILAKGSRVRYDDPFFTSFDIDELLIHMSNICRYNGAIKIDLLRHSLLVSFLVWEEIEDTDNKELNNYISALAAIHDMQEAIVGDIVTPLKAKLPGFSELESKWEDWVLVNTGLSTARWNTTYRDPEIAKQIKAADTRALVLETAFRNHPRKDHFFDKYALKEISKNDMTGLTILYSLPTEQLVNLFKKTIGLAVQPLNSFNQGALYG